MTVSKPTPPLLERAVAALRQAEDVPDQLLAHLSLLGREHVNLTGDYIWSECGAAAQAASGRSMNTRPVAHVVGHVKRPGRDRDAWSWRSPFVRLTHAFPAPAVAGSANHDPTSQASIR